MIPITLNLSIPDDSIEFIVSRSWGPGGQNVNKVSSRVTLRFDIDACEVLTPLQRRRIRVQLQTRINKKGILQVTSQKTTSQHFNRAHAVERFAELLRAALHEKPKRFPTGVTRTAKDERIVEKKKHAEIKKLRSQKDWDD